MLAQTQVIRVIAPYRTFLDRFPTVADCADAPVSAVIEAWAGLGYNRRAVNLHRLAVRLVDENGARVPDTLEDLLELPGVGPYTARAVLVFAFEHDVGVVDTNVARVLARWDAHPFHRRAAQDRADALVPEHRGWTWNQAMLDLGALVCTAANPDCDGCPVRCWCAWHGDGADPAVGTAGTGSRQSRFEGSDRQGRGRLVDALRRGPVTDDPGALASVMGWPDDPARAARVAATLVTDGLVVVRDGTFRLP
ncbi:MAG: A/G-specific adenine glycosylase [Actinobacteria bacterium]|nr:A/G-specific adenine glycosylase [Actinomycetota bacterium]